MALRRRKQRGNTLLEFGLCLVLLVPLYMSMVIMGMDLKRVMQTNQIARDTGHMFARWVDFSQTGNQNLVVRLASGLQMTRTSGGGVVILSKLMRIGTQQCTDGGVSTAQCTNLNKTVVTQRIVIGNKLLKTSKIATPSDAIVTSNGTLTAANYLKNSTAVATNFESILTLGDGELAFVTEAWFESPVRDFPTLNNRGPVYARSIF
ncbi:MAG: hypothetical protein HY821_15560 [Acidobacteria bacterium]|nr:hypothetical protein [Acidobacteriota bacterium]